MGCITKMQQYQHEACMTVRTVYVQNVGSCWEEYIYSIYTVYIYIYTVYTQYILGCKMQNVDIIQHSKIELKRNKQTVHMLFFLSQMIIQTIK